MRAAAEQARYGLRYLFEGLNANLRGPYAHERDHSHVHLEGHPFGPKMGVLGCEDLPNQNVCLIAHPDNTDASVRGMILMLQKSLQGYHPDSYYNEPFRMRIIKVEQEVFWKHNLYFELITPGYTFFAGGCNDYSGGGGRGGQQLTDVFALVNFVYEIQVEEVNIFNEKGAPLEKGMRDAYNQFITGKEESAA